MWGLFEITFKIIFSPGGPSSPARSEGALPHSSHPRLAMPTPLVGGGRLTLPGLLGQLPPPGWPHTLPPGLTGLNPALFKSGKIHSIRVGLRVGLLWRQLNFKKSFNPKLYMLYWIGRVNPWVYLLYGLMWNEQSTINWIITIVNLIIFYVYIKNL